MAYPSGAVAAHSACRFHPACTALAHLLTTTPRSGPEWIHEVKHDGYRLIAKKEFRRVTLWSRYATSLEDYANHQFRRLFTVRDQSTACRQSVNGLTDRLPFINRRHP